MIWFYIPQLQVDFLQVIFAIFVIQPHAFDLLLSIIYYWYSVHRIHTSLEDTEIIDEPKKYIFSVWYLIVYMVIFWHNMKRKALSS